MDHARSDACRTRRYRARRGGPGGILAKRREFRIHALVNVRRIAFARSSATQTLYNPLQGSASTGWGSMRGALDQVVAAAGWVKDSLSTPEQLFTPRGAAVGFLLIAVPVAVVVLARRVVKAMRRPSGGLRRRGWIGRLVGRLSARIYGDTPDRTRIVVAFYEQFHGQLMGVAGFTARQDQTQREFARQVEEGLAGRKAPAVLLRFPGELAEIFYHVRFGDRMMQSFEIAEVEHRLQQLKAFLKL